MTLAGRVSAADCLTGPLASRHLGFHKNPDFEKENTLSVIILYTYLYLRFQCFFSV